MNAKVINKENNVVKFTFQASAEMLEEGMKFSYKKNKDKIAMQGFRKGKAPRKVIESVYGSEIFYDDAINFILNTEYEVAIKELGLDVVSRPEIDATSVDKSAGVEFEVSVTVKPEVTLGAYKGLEVEKVEDTVSEEEIEAEINKVREGNSRVIDVTDRAAKTGDTATISYLGTVDGVAFEGGQADSHNLVLGSKSFIDTFEEQIEGHNIGDAFDVTVKFPEEYHAPDLAGKEAVFAVELKGITEKELPELNDEFAQDVSEFDTMEEYKASIVAKLEEAAKNKAKQILSDKLLDKAVENATMDIPAVMYDNKIDQMMQEFAGNIQRQGLSIEVYCQYLGTTVEGLRENFKDSAEKSVKARLILEEVVKAENLTISEEDLNAEIIKIGEGYGLEADKILEIFRDEDKAMVEEDLLVRNALQVIEDSAVLV